MNCLMLMQERKQSDMRVNESFGGKKGKKKLFIFFFCLIINVFDGVKKNIELGLER